MKPTKKLSIRRIYLNSRWLYRSGGATLHIIDKDGRTCCGLNLSPVYPHKRLTFTGTPTDLCRRCKSSSKDYLDYE